MPRKMPIGGAFGATTDEDDARVEVVGGTTTSGALASRATRRCTYPANQWSPNNIEGAEEPDGPRPREPGPSSSRRWPRSRNGLPAKGRGNAPAHMRMGRRDTRPRPGLLRTSGPAHPARATKAATRASGAKPLRETAGKRAKMARLRRCTRRGRQRAAEGRTKRVAPAFHWAAQRLFFGPTQTATPPLNTSAPLPPPVTPDPRPPWPTPWTYRW